MPCGRSNAPATFQALMTRVLGPCADEEGVQRDINTRALRTAHALPSDRLARTLMRTLAVSRLGARLRDMYSPLAQRKHARLSAAGLRAPVTGHSKASKTGPAVLCARVRMRFVPTSGKTRAGIFVQEPGKQPCASGFVTSPAALLCHQLARTTVQHSNRRP